MSLTERPKRFELSDATAGAERPKIWVDGRQRPRFDLRAFGAVALGMAKRALPPEMIEAETRLTGFGRRVQAGEVRVRMDWAGKAARAVPSHHRVGGWLLGLARLFADTRVILAGAEEEKADLAYANLIRGSATVRPRPAPGVRPAAEEPTLHAIRSAIGATPHEAGPEQPEAGGDSTHGLSRRVTQSLWRAACHGLLGLLMAYALPAGAVRALIYHLDGGDLSDWS